MEEKSSTSSIKRFAIIGVAGYIANKHLQAIKKIGGEIIMACDLTDNVGFLDGYGYIKFYKNENEFFKLLSTADIDYLSICTPNYLHYRHIKKGLKAGVNIICEKPLVLDPRQIEKIKNLEIYTGKFVYTIMQLRYDEGIQEIKKAIQRSERIIEIRVKYRTPRGPWYQKTWKADEKKSGGLIINIGIHVLKYLYDIIPELWVDGIRIIEATDEKVVLKLIGYRKRTGEYPILCYWYQVEINLELSIAPSGKAIREIWIPATNYRWEKIIIGSCFSSHDKSYKEIMRGRGFRPWAARDALELACKIREAIKKYKQEIQ